MLASEVATLQDNSIHGDDSYLTRDLGGNSFMDVVLDGVTGCGGEEASRSVRDALAKASVNSPDEIVMVLERANEEFYQVGGGRFLLTTVSVALFLNGRLNVISAGDSPVYLFGPGSCQQLSGRVGGFLHAGVAKPIGAGPSLANLARAEVPVKPGDRLLLATDGLSDNIQRDDLEDMVRRAASPQEAAVRIEEAVAALLREGRAPAQLGGRFRHDDRTAIIRFFSADEEMI
jgi:serine/threonine protein phosphatase PrpC